VAGPSAASTNGAAHINQLDAELEGTSVDALAILRRDSRDRASIEATAFFCQFTGRDESMTADVTRSARLVQAIMTRRARGRAVCQKGLCLRRTVVADHRGRRKVVESRGTRAHYRKCQVASLSRTHSWIAGISQSTARPHLALLSCLRAAVGLRCASPTLPKSDKNEVKHAARLFLTAGAARISESIEGTTPELPQLCRLQFGRKKATSRKIPIRRGNVRYCG
jgi:hypothetical protein